MPRCGRTTGCRRIGRKIGILAGFDAGEQPRVDADDGHGRGVEGDALADNREIAAKTTRPVAIADDGNRFAGVLQSSGISTSAKLPGVAAATAAAIVESLLLMSLHRPLPSTTIATLRPARFC